ncbi:hypothetical protein RV09_GL000195 [Enterococcus moraviensis]|nr:hypothetical protein RV09_GL000195 [Enterococcus moraviensis]
MTILKKRYGLVLIITSLSIVLFYGYKGIQDVNQWKYMQNYYNSEQYQKDLSEVSEEENPKFKGLSFKERENLDKKEGLSLFNQTNSYDEQGNITTDSKHNTTYYTMYFNENSLLLLVVIVSAGFLMFFVDLKTSFNEFLFSLGVSKRRIYFSKFALISIPILLSVLLAKILFIGIITLSIPSEYVNISLAQLAMNVLASWTTCIIYYFTATFIGLVTGNIILGPLTALGFCASFEYFIAAVINAWYYFTKTSTDIYVTNRFFNYSITKDPISTLPIVFTVMLSLLLLIFGSYLFQTLTLEKKGKYLLFDGLKLPVIIAMTLYVPIVLVFSRGYYLYEDGTSPIPGLLIYAIITAIIGIYLIFRKEFHGSISHIKQTLKNNNVRT